ncbi:MAG TPA: UbiA family prenyltransferase [Anaerolineales bacterium]
MILEKKIKGFIQLFRPELPFAAGVCIILGEFIGLGRFPSIREALLGFMCGFFISGSALVSNDYFDLEVDKVNAPERPLPSGVISPSEAIILTILATMIGLAASLVIGFYALILSIIFWWVGFLYNWRFKQTGLLGNLMVASSVAFTVILGGITVGQPFNRLVWFFSLIAFLIDLAEEIAGDAMDVEGDKKRNSKSIAIMLGKNAALRISGAVFVLIVLISFIPVFLGWLGIAYLVVISITDLLVLFFTAKLLKSQTPKEGRGYMRWIYLGGLLGMLAFIIGQAFS